MEQGSVQEQEHSFGSHRVRFEPPDLMYLFWNGAVRAEHIRRLSDIVASTGQQNLLVVNDLSRSDIPDAHARRVAAEDERLRQLRAMAIVGASKPMRAVTNLIIRATTFFLGPQRTRVRFVETEAEALAWLDTQRE